MKKFRILLLALLLVLGSVQGVFATESTVNLINASKKGIIISAPNSTELTESDSQNIDVRIENRSGKTLRGVVAKATIINPSSVMINGSTYMTYTDSSTSKTLVRDGFAEFKIPLKILQSVDATIPIQIEVTYTEDGVASDVTVPETIYVYQKAQSTPPTGGPGPVTNTNTSEGIIIKANETTLAKDQEIHTLPITITNLGNGKITNAVITAEIDNPTVVFIHDEGSRVIDIPDKTFFQLRTLMSDKDTTVPVKLKVDYVLNGEPKSHEQTIYVIKKASNSTSILEVKKIDTFPLGYVSPGDTFNIGFEIYNPGDAPARNIKLSLDGLKADGINMANGLNTQDLTLLPAKSKATVYYALKVAPQVIGGMQPLTLKYTFVGKTPSGSETSAPVSGEYNFSVEVKKASMAPSTIIFDRVTFPQGQVGKNKNVTISFTLKNIGTKKAQNLNISAVSENTAAVSPTSGSTAIVKELNPGQKADYSFSFKTTNSATTGNYPVNMAVEYVDDSTTVDKPHKITQTVGINVIDWEAEALKDKDKPTSTPKLIVEKYEFIPNIIYAGTTFNMNLVLYNTNDTKTIENVKIFLTSETMQSSNTGNTTTTNASVFTPINSSNTFHIDSIPPGGKVEKTVTLGSSRDTAAKTYTITANLEYEDKQANKYTSQEIIGVPVLQESKLGIGEISLEQQYFVGQSSPISVEFYNTGKVSLSNFMVNFEGEGLKADTPSYYKGNFPSGTSDTFNINVTPESPEATKGKITFSFEDSTGESHEIEKEFTLNVEDMGGMMEGEFDPVTGMPIDPNTGLPMDPNAGQGGGLPILPIAIGAAALGGGGFLLWKKRKAKKDEEDLTIDED